MTNKSGTGHNSNVVNFKSMVSFTTGYGTAYNPSLAGLSIASLNSICNKGEQAFRLLQMTESTFKSARTARLNLFKPLQKRITRVWNAFLAGAPNDEIRQTVRSLVQKLRGIRISGRLTKEEKQALAAQGKESNEISSSQMGYNELVENFGSFISLLAQIPGYAPNEQSLQLESLSELHTDLRAKNQAVIDAYQPFSSARILRDETLYTKNTGLVDVALQVKAYIRSVYGARSEQFKQISGLRFKRYAKPDYVKPDEPVVR